MEFPGSLNRWLVPYNPPIGSIYHLHTTYILPIGWLYITYHLLREPETAIDLIPRFTRSDNLYRFNEDPDTSNIASDYWLLFWTLRNASNTQDSTDWTNGRGEIGGWDTLWELTLLESCSQSCKFATLPACIFYSNWDMNMLVFLWICVLQFYISCCVR